MSHQENGTNKISDSGLGEKLSLLVYLAYAACYLVGARIIRFFRRCRRRMKTAFLHLKWAVRRRYFDMKEQKEQRRLIASTGPSLKKEWSGAIGSTKNALQDWSRQRKLTGKLMPAQLLGAFKPCVRPLSQIVNYLLPLAGIIILTSTVYHFSTLTYGLRVQYNGEHIGYILSESDFSEAESLVKKRIVNEVYLPPEDSVPIYSLEIVEDDQISEQDILVNNIIRASGNEIVEAAGLYVNDEFVGAVTDGDELLRSLKERKEGSYSAEAPEEQEAEIEEEDDEEEEEEQPDENQEYASTELRGTYIIQEGDSPWSIANKFGISTQDIIDLNPEVSKTMLVGQTLIISDEGVDSIVTDNSDESGEIDESESAEQKAGSNLPPSPEGAVVERETISFVQSIRLEKGLYPTSSVETLDDINLKLDSVVEGEQTYTIKQGDSPWSIANMFDISTQTLVALNPEVSKRMLVGDTFIISQEQPFLQTKVVRTVTQEQEVDFKTETEVDQNKEKSYQKVLQEGKKGLDEVTSEITYIDGYETERNVVYRTTITEPVDAKIVVGSLTSSIYRFSDSAPSGGTNVGGYIWPVNGGYISCPIWGYTNHTGTDIAAPAGTTIWAAKGGTVAHAGWSNGYGYNVLINHPDGTKTRYAHCSKLAVYAGQQVSQGQVIGYIGRTGWATGNHCHFEIISGGRFLDARPYIGYSR